MKTKPCLLAASFCALLCQADLAPAQSSPPRFGYGSGEASAPARAKPKAAPRAAPTKVAASAKPKTARKAVASAKVKPLAPAKVKAKAAPKALVAKSPPAARPVRRAKDPAPLRPSPAAALPRASGLLADISSSPAPARFHFFGSPIILPSFARLIPASAPASQLASARSPRRPSASAPPAPREAPPAIQPPPLTARAFQPHPAGLPEASASPVNLEEPPSALALPVSLALASAPPETAPESNLLDEPSVASSPPIAAAPESDAASIFREPAQPPDSAAPESPSPSASSDEDLSERERAFIRSLSEAVGSVTASSSPSATPETPPPTLISAPAEKLPDQLPSFEAPATGKIDIQSDRQADHDEANHKVIYTGTVELNSAALRLRAERVEVFMKKTGSGIERVEASGNVLLRTQDTSQGPGQMASAGRATYHLQSGEIALADWPKIQETTKSHLATASSTKMVLFTDGRHRTDGPNRTILGGY